MPGLEVVEAMAAVGAMAAERRTPWVVTSAEAATLAAATLAVAISAEFVSAADLVSAEVPTLAVARTLAAPGLRFPGLRQGRVSTPNGHLLFVAAVP
jgi:hypothetical protein